MSSIYYDLNTQPKDFSELFKLRAKTQTELLNDLGCFVIRNDLPQQDIGKNNYGVVLMDGLPWIGDQHQTAQSIADKLTNNVDHNKLVFKSIRGLPAIVYVTEEHVMFSRCGAPEKTLYYYYEPDNKKFTVTSFSKDLFSKYGNYMRVQENLLYVFNKYNFKMHVEQFKTWNFEQYRNNWDKVYESHEHAVRMCNHPNSLYMLSSGMDSGAIVCAARNINIDHHVCHIITDIEEENAVLNARFRAANDKKHVHMFRAVENSKNPDRKPYKEFMNSKQSSAGSLNNQPFMDSHNQAYEKICKPLGSIKVIQGQGGDSLYGDYGFRGKRTRPSSIFGGVFPANLQEVWKEVMSSNADVKESLDVLWGIRGIAVSFPLMDLDLIQEFLNTTRNLKNSRYKNWLAQYMEDSNYPYTNLKGGWGGYNWKELTDIDQILKEVGDDIIGMNSMG